MATAGVFLKETFRAATELYEDRQIETYPYTHKLLTTLALVPVGTLIAPAIFTGVIFRSEKYRTNLQNTWIKRNETE